jgi:hypothetical protein
MTFEDRGTPKERAVRALNRLQDEMRRLQEAQRNISDDGVGFEILLQAQQTFDRARVDYFQASRAAYGR